MKDNLIDGKKKDMGERLEKAPYSFFALFYTLKIKQVL